MDSSERALDVLASVSGHDRASLRPELDLVADLGLDSTQALRLLVELEDALALEIDDEDVAHVSTVGDVLAFVRRLAERAR